MRFTIAYLLGNGLISTADSEKLNSAKASKPMSIYWHVRLMLYLGVTLLSAGLGTLIYKNIDTIGHITIVVLIGLLSAGTFIYCFKKSARFSLEKVDFPNAWLDYVLLLGVTSFLTFEGYLQFEFEIFGNHYGLATIIPAIFLFLIAYRFDHIGVLAMAITLLASWLGIALTPKELIVSNDFSEESLVFAGLGLSLMLTAIGYLTNNQNIKKHFTFTYYNFALHLGAIATLGATFSFDYDWLWIFVLVPIVVNGVLLRR